MLRLCDIQRAGEIMKNVITTIAAAILMALAVSAPARATNHATSSAAQAAGSFTDGEIRKVDKQAKKLTIRHGPLETLGMPAMTMVFQVNDPSMLDTVKAGDKVKFVADKVGGSYTVTHLEISE
jgi:Cu/Ag efflux protein CusF